MLSYFYMLSPLLSLLQVSALFKLLYINLSYATQSEAARGVQCSKGFVEPFSGDDAGDCIMNSSSLIYFLDTASRI